MDWVVLTRTGSQSRLWIRSEAEFLVMVLFGWAMLDLGMDCALLVGRV
jgi:hypothetical protein